MTSIRIAIYASIVMHFARRILSRIIPDNTPRVFCFTHYQYSPIVLLCVAEDSCGPKNDMRSEYGKGYIRFRTPEQIADIARKQHKSVLSLEEAARKFPDAYGDAFRTSGPYYPHRTQTNDAARQIRKLLGQPS
jgi:hypothetical protein